MKVTQEYIARSFRVFDAAGLRRPPGMTDEVKACEIYAYILRKLTQDDVKRGTALWVESGAEFYPTAVQLAKACEQAKGRPDLADTLAAIVPEPGDVLPLVERLRPRDWPAYLEAFADGPDGETKDQIFDRMAAWVRQKVESY